MVGGGLQQADAGHRLTCVLGRSARWFSALSSRRTHERRRPAQTPTRAFAAVWGKSGDVRARRDDFLDACVGYADELRVRQAPDEGSLGSMVLEDCRKLTLARDGIVDGVGLEAGIMPESKFTELLVEVLERLLELKSRPVELSRWQDDWFGAHAVFVYEFLYVVASLLQAGRLEVLHAMFRTHYLKPRAERYGAGTDSARFMGTVGLLAKRCARMAVAGTSVLRRSWSSARRRDATSASTHSSRPSSSCFWRPWSTEMCGGIRGRCITRAMGRCLISSSGRLGTRTSSGWAESSAWRRRTRCGARLTRDGTGIPDGTRRLSSLSE